MLVGIWIEGLSMYAGIIRVDTILEIVGSFRIRVWRRLQGCYSLITGGVDLCILV